MRDIKLKNNKEEAFKPPRSFNYWLNGGLLAVVIFILLFFGLKVSYRQLRQARQDYYDQVARLKKEDLTVTIIEGWRREQIAALLEKNKIVNQEDFLAATINLEGQLFPDTYRFFPNSPVQEVISKFSTNFNQKTADLNLSESSSLILASIIEREAANDEERAKIAGVYLNRLNSDMLLEADPTVQYGRDDQKCQMSDVRCRMSDYWQPISREEIERIVSPYNTYKNKGLPPGPISNPGLKSIEATLNPTKHNYFFFFHSQDGSLIFSRTLLEHNQNKSVFGVRSVD